MSRERDEGLEVAYDELRLSHEEFGSVGMPLLFVHGLGCDRTDFSYQIERFGRERRVVAVDLRGHGQSIRPEGDYSVPTFADDLARLCSELELERPAIVGHSMGGQVALDLAARYPGFPGAVVMLDSTVLPPSRFTEFLRPFSAAMRTPGYREALHRFFEYAFAPTDNPGRKERLLERISLIPQHVAQPSWESVFSAWDGAAAAAGCETPVLYVDHGSPVCDLDHLRELCPQLLQGKTVGAGHWAMLEVPEQVDAMIGRLLEMVRV